MMGCVVLPLPVWLDVQKLHEGVQFNFVEFVSQVLSMNEVLVFQLNVLNHFLWWPVFNFTSLTFFFFSAFFSSFLFFGFLAFFLFLFFFFFLFAFSFSLSSLNFLELSVDS
jgi:hypothetical protein